MNSSALKKILTNLFLLLAFALPALAQQEAGQINGTVKDPTSAVIAGAAVSVRSIATNAVRTATTDGQGMYVVANLQPGTYEVTATMQGFQDAKETVQVTVGGRITVNLTAGVQDIRTETVSVTSGGGAEINTTDQQLATTVTGKQIQQLPILNRNPYSLVNLSGNISTGDPTERGAGVAINGMRAASTSILLDGAENNDIFTATIAQTTPLESVSEFQVITSNFSAEYGRASGGIVNVSTRAGSNLFNGSLFAFNRNSALAANSFENNAKGVSRPHFNRNQFGYFVGGPIVKDKLFFTNSTEWTIIRSNSTQFAYVPTQSFINSANINTRNFFAAYGQLRGKPIGAPVTIGDSATPNFQLVAYNVPSDAGGGDPQDTYSTSTRIDWNINEKTQLYGRYAQERPKFAFGAFDSSPYEGFDIGETDLRHNFLLNLTRTFTPNLVSNTKSAFRRAKFTYSFGKPTSIPSLYFFNTQVASFNGNLIALPGYIFEDPNNAPPGDETQSQFQVNQDFNYNHGKHNFKFGGQYVYIRDRNAFPAFVNARLSLGITLDEALANLANGQLRQLEVAVDPQGKFPGGTLNLPVGYPSFVRDNSYNEFALYFNDGWRISPRLNLNLGVRYEYYGVQKSKSGMDSNFYFGSGNSIQERIRNGAVGIASEHGGLWQPDKNNFAPRVGFAWDMFGDGKTSLRGGYGIAFERNFGNVTFNIIQNPPFYAVLSVFQEDFGGSLPIPISSFGPLAGSSGSAILPRSSLRHVREDIVNAWAHLYSMALEREILKDTTARVEFSGSAGRKLFSLENINRAGAGLRYLGSNNASVCPPGIPANTRLNCQYSNINTRGNNGFSNYNSLSLSLVSNNVRDSGLAMTARYTYGVAKDNLSSTFSESSNNFNLGLTDPFDPSYDYSNSDFDVRHRFVGSFNYDIPYAKNLSNGFAKRALDGFTLTGIFTAQSGTPFTIFDCTTAVSVCLRLKPTAPLARSNSNPTPLAGANVFRYLDLSNQVPFEFDDGVSGGASVGPFPRDVTPRNFFRAPGYWNFDFGVIKQIKFSERYGLQLRTEFINAFNTTRFIIDGANAEVNSGMITASKEGTGPKGTLLGKGTQRTIQLSAKFIF